MSDVLFSTKAAPVTGGRYTVASTRETAEGGRVGVGVDRKGDAYLVHIIGRQSEACALHAVATAVAGGIIPVDALVSAFVETKQLDKLRKAIEKVGS